MKRTVLAVDIGTSSLKAALIDARGTILAEARCRFPEGKRTGADWNAAFSEAVALICPDDGLAAVSVSGNGPTLIAVGPDGTDGEILLWNDPIPAAPLYRTVGIEKPGMPNGRDTAQSVESPSLFLPRIDAYRTLYPETFKTARHILSGPEYLIYRLTGEAVTILPDQRFTPAYWTESQLVRAGIDPAKLPPFVLTGAIVGTTRASGSTGAAAQRSASPASPSAPARELPSGIPVVACGPDFVAALIGTASLEPGRACDRAGTSEGLNLCTALNLAVPGVRTLPSVIPGLWNASVLLPDTGALFHDWRRASGQIDRSYPEIMTEIESSPILNPPGTPPHPGREVVEEIGFAVRRAIEILNETYGCVQLLTLSGGQARNDIWNRMKADITGAAFALTATPDGELMGGAITAFTALGDYGSLTDAARAMVSITRIYEPDPARHALYTEKYLRHEDLRTSR
jgi:xylulokinase